MIGFGEDRIDKCRLVSPVGPSIDNCPALARLIVHGFFEETLSRKTINKAANECLPMIYIYSASYLLPVIRRVVEPIGAHHLLSGTYTPPRTPLMP